MLAVVETHPIQYHAPVYRALQRDFGVPVTVIYGSDISTHRYHDTEFGAAVAWDVDLLSGYGHEFLSRVAGRQTMEPTAHSGRGVGRALKRLSPSATLITGYSPAFHRRAWLAAWRVGAPVLFRGEATDRPQTSHAIVRRVRDAGLHFAYRRCARVLYIGERARRHYRLLGVENDRLVFSPYCVDTAPFRMTEADRGEQRAAARARLGIGDDNFVLLFSGKISARKGVDLLVEAVRQLPDPLRNRAVIVCAGDGVERQAMIRAAARHPPVPLHMLGVQTQADLSQWYHMADVLVLPSRHGETWGLVVNEALHHGLPCVVSDRVGCSPDLIDDRTGVVCTADSSDDLARAITHAHSLTGRAEIRDACRSKVALYSVERAAAGIAEAYRAVTMEPAGP